MAMTKVKAINRAAKKLGCSINDVCYALSPAANRPEDKTLKELTEHVDGICMAMTKKEEAEVQAKISALEAEIERIKTLAAFRRTDKVEPDILPSKGLELVTGWIPVAARSDSPRIEKACSTSVGHGYGWEKTSSQGPKNLYSTPELAIKRLRWEVEQAAAEKLRAIDIYTERFIA